MSRSDLPYDARSALSGRLLTRAVLVGALLGALLGVGSTGEVARAGDDVPTIDGADTKARLDRAAELEATNVDGLAAALLAMGEQKLKGDALASEIEFLVEYTIREECRLLRLLAIDAAARLDKKAAAALYAKKADGEHPTQSAFAVEGLAHTGDKTHRDKFLEMAKSPSELIAIRACDAIARAGDKKLVNDLVEMALTHESEHAALHAVWAVQDLVKKQPAAIKRVQKAVGRDKEGPRAIRASPLVALLQDQLATPHVYRKDLKALRELVEKAPATIEIKAGAKTHAEAIEAALKFLEDELPGAHLTVRVAAVRIDVPGIQKDSLINLKDDVIDVPLKYTLQKPGTLAYHLVRSAVVLLQKRIGDPYAGHRGWENPILETFEVCQVARLYDVDSGAVSRDAFIWKIIQQRPWGGK